MNVLRRGMSAASWLRTRVRTIVRGVVAGSTLAMTFSVLATAAPGCGSSPAPESVCPPNQTCQVHLTLLHTGDIHSQLFPFSTLITQIDSQLGLGSVNTVGTVGGVAAMSYILGRERARSDRVIHLDSGDSFEGAPIFNFYSGEPEMRSLGMMGTDAMVIGNHDFDRGALNLGRQLQQWAAFPPLAANYQFDPIQNNPGNTLIASVTHPFTVLDQAGLKIGVIGMGNLSSLTSIFDVPNRLGFRPLDTVEVAQFYVDMLRPFVDVVIVLSHLGLQTDQRMVASTTGIDVVMGGHNHIVIDPPQTLTDCSIDPQNPGYVWVLNPDVPFDIDNPIYDKLDTTKSYPNQIPRKCTPRNVLIMQSGAFSKYVGRMDLELSNDPATASPTGKASDYDPNNGFEVISSTYIPFPITDTAPQDPVMVDMLQPYLRTLDNFGDLDVLVGFSPQGALRNAPQGGDSPLGNLISTSMWLRIGVQTDFSMTNSTGIRTNLAPGPVDIQEMYNIFPFDNTITTMTLSGTEVYEMFDFIARTSATRGCESTAQIAGSRVRLDCSACTRTNATIPCQSDIDCAILGTGGCDLATKSCAVVACADQVYIGYTQSACNADSDCPSQAPGSCDTSLPLGKRLCLSPVQNTNLYQLATSNYLAGGGSGFRVLQENTTQVNTQVQQRDAVIDYVRQGKPCGYDPTFTTAEGLKACQGDADCTDQGDFVCACPGSSHLDTTGGIQACLTSASCSLNVGRCVRRDCRDQVAQFHDTVCDTSPNKAGCQQDLNSCVIAGEECKLLACVDATLGANSDNRVEMLGR